MGGVIKMTFVVGAFPNPCFRTHLSSKRCFDLVHAPELEKGVEGKGSATYPASLFLLPRRSHW